MAEQPAISLRTLPRDESEKQSLAYLIARINAQKGLFRNITEDSVRQEIRETTDGVQLSDEAEDDESSSENESVDGKSRREEVLAARDEVIKFALEALTQSSHALDFVSLVLSKYAPRQAELTISQFVRNSVPSGSLGTELTQPPDTRKADSDDVWNDGLVSVGWKLQSLNASADQLLESASKLEKEMQQEERFWDRVLAIKQNGWSICRLPRESHTLGVRFGFSEASPEFRDKGLAALRRGVDGEIDLDLGSNISLSESLQVRVVQNGHTLATSAIANRATIEIEPVEVLLLKARDCIFDAELYHELYREGRNLANRGVTCLSDGIAVPLDDDKILRVEMVENYQTDEESMTLDPEYAEIPHFMATALRILLCHAHRQNYNRRTKPPPPYTGKKTTRPYPTILRPVLCHIQHRLAVKSLVSSLAHQQSNLAEASIEWDFGPPVNEFNLAESLKPNSPNESYAFVEFLVDALCATIVTKFKVKNKLGTFELTISVGTHANATGYKINIDTFAERSLIAELPRELELRTLAEVLEHIQHIILLDLVTTIANQPSSKWESTSPHCGELTTAETEDGFYQLIRLSFDNDGLGLAWFSYRDIEQLEEQHQWAHGHERSEGQKGLFDEVNRIDALDPFQGPIVPDLDVALLEAGLE